MLVPEGLFRLVFGWFWPFWPIFAQWGGWGRIWTCAIGLCSPHCVEESSDANSHKNFSVPHIHRVRTAAAPPPCMHRARPPAPRSLLHRPPVTFFHWRFHIQHSTSSTFHLAASLLGPIQEKHFHEKSELRGPSDRAYGGFIPDFLPRFRRLDHDFRWRPKKIFTPSKSTV